MRTPPKVMVPVDLSAISRAALEYACDMRTTFAAAVDVFYVWSTPNAPLGDERSLRALEPFAAGALTWDVFDFLQRLDGAGTVHVRGYVTLDRFGKTLPELAAAEGYDLVIAGAPARTMAARFRMHGGRGAEPLDAQRAAEVVSVPPRRACPIVTVGASGGRGRGAPDTIERKRTRAS